jgi:hypothetical protein
VPTSCGSTRSTPPRLRQELADTAEAAEEAGLSWLSVMDHFFQIDPATDPVLEACTTLGFLAARTETVQLGARHDGFVAAVRPYADLGVESVILTPPATSLAAWVRDALAPAVPRLAELGARGGPPVARMDVCGGESRVVGGGS